MFPVTLQHIAAVVLTFYQAEHTLIMGAVSKHIIIESRLSVCVQCRQFHRVCFVKYA